MKAVLSCLACLLAGGLTAAQTSPGYRLTEFALNAGGHPGGGRMLTSAGYRITIDAVGDAALGPALRSASFAMDAGFGRSYPPPLEVRELRAMPDGDTFAWVPDASVGGYLVYRGDLDAMPGPYGACLGAVPHADVLLDETPEPGRGFYFIVTARSRLMEEGPMGLDSAGAPRAGASPCP